MGDDAMCACYSSDAKHLAVGLLDATVKVGAARCNPTPRTLT